MVRKLHEDWDEEFLEMLDIFEKKSKCIKHKVACIIVKDNKILSFGVNGTISGSINCNDVYMEKFGKVYRNIDPYKIKNINSPFNLKLDYYFENIDIFIDLDCTFADFRYYDILFSLDEMNLSIIDTFEKDSSKFINLTGQNLEDVEKANPKVIFSIWEDVTNLPDSDPKSHHYWAEINEVHAEMNALANILDTKELKYSVVYVSYLPCFNCAKMLTLFGVRKIVYKHEYDRSEEVKRFLRCNNVEVISSDEIGDTLLKKRL